MWRRRTPVVPDSQLRAEEALAHSLRGGDSLPAWNAIWDLVQSADSQAKHDVLAAIRGYVSEATTNEPVAIARTFENALEESLRPIAPREQVLPSLEVRDQYKRDQIEASRKAMRDIGVRPGEGLPMWSLYMTRRSKRTWG